VPQRVMIRAGLWVSVLIYPVLVAIGALAA